MKTISKILYILIALIGGSVQANDHNTGIDFFSKITPETHPAVPYILAWLDTQVQKDYEAFAAFFNSESNLPLFINLPGGKVFRDSKELLLRHKEFYESPVFEVVREDLCDGMGNPDFFTCSVLVHVTFPNGAKRSNYIDVTFIKSADLEPRWVPARIINTVIDSAK